MSIVDNIYKIGIPVLMSEVNWHSGTYPEISWSTATPL